MISRFLPHGRFADDGRERPEVCGASGTFRILLAPMRSSHLSRGLQALGDHKYLQQREQLGQLISKGSTLTEYFREEI